MVESTNNNNINHNNNINNINNLNNLNNNNNLLNTNNNNLNSDDISETNTNNNNTNFSNRHNGLFRRLSDRIMTNLINRQNSHNANQTNTNTNINNNNLINQNNPNNYSYDEDENENIEEYDEDDNAENDDNNAENDDENNQEDGDQSWEYSSNQAEQNNYYHNDNNPNHNQSFDGSEYSKVSRYSFDSGEFSKDCTLNSDFLESNLFMKNFRPSTAPVRPTNEAEEFKYSGQFLHIEKLIQCCHGLIIKPDTKFDVDSEEGADMCKLFLDRLEILVQSMRIPTQSREYRLEFSKAYKYLYEKGNLCYLTEILDSAQEGIQCLWVNSEKYSFSKQVLDYGNELYNAFCTMLILLRRTYNK